MIKIVSGIDSKKGGHNSTIWSSHNKTEDFMSRGILSPNAKSVAENAEFYTIQFFDDYYVFSKHKIVRDNNGNNRMGVLSFSLAISNQIDILDNLESLQSDYKNDNLDFHLRKENKPTVELKTKNNKKTQEPEKETVYLYYKNEEELKTYFKRDSDYRKFKRIFFISASYKEQDNDPLNSIQHDREIDFVELVAPDTPCNNETSIKETITKIRKNRIVILLFGLLLGIGGTVGYPWLLDNEVNIDNYDNSQSSYLQQQITVNPHCAPLGPQMLKSSPQQTKRAYFER